MVSAFKQALHPIRRFTKLTWAEKFVARDGNVLKAQVFEPHSEPRDTIVFFHGVAAAPSGTEAYKVLLHYLNREGFRVIAVDQRGHGKSSGTLNVEKMQTDVVDILKSLKEKGITVREGGIFSRKKRVVKLSSVQIATHSLGGVVAAGGLLHAHNEGANIPEINGFFAYAPPQDMKNLAIIKNVEKALRPLKHYPRRVANFLASVIYPLKTDRLAGPNKIATSAWGSIRSIFTGKVHADQLRLNSTQQFIQEINKVPNFVSVFAELERAKAKPKFNLVWLGTRDSDTETRDAAKRRRYTLYLRDRGINVKAIPFTHHPTINPLSKFSIFKLSERIAKDVAGVSTAAERAERISRTSLVPTEPKE